MRADPTVADDGRHGHAPPTPKLPSLCDGCSRDTCRGCGIDRLRQRGYDSLDEVSVALLADRDAARPGDGL